MHFNHSRRNFNKSSNQIRKQECISKNEQLQNSMDFIKMMMKKNVKQIADMEHEQKRNWMFPKPKMQLVLDSRLSQNYALNESQSSFFV